MTHKTSNYTLFKKFPGNRPIDALNLKKITTSIKMNNMLQLRPILVNDLMEVVDGQHRLEAAKNLGLEVFYDIVHDTKPMDMVLLNNAQKCWTLQDYVNYYAEQGSQIYKDMKSMSEKFDLSIQELVRVLGIHWGRAYKDFKEGKYAEDVKKKEAELRDKVAFMGQVIAFIDEKTLGNKIHLKSIALKRSLLTLLGCTSFDPTVFMEKLELGISKFHRCTTATQYYDMFKAFYNYRNQNPLE